MIASHNGHHEVVSILLSSGANIKAQNRNGWTSLMYASQSGRQEVVSILLSHGANVESQDHEGRTSLLAASKYGHKEVVSILLCHGAHIEPSLLNTSSPEILSLLSSFQRWRERRNFLTLLTHLTHSQSQFPLTHNLSRASIVLNLEEMKREISYFL